MKTSRVSSGYYSFLRLGATATVLAVCQPGNAQAAGTTWWVANNGLDGAHCGTRASPCRSIGQALAKANDGDTVAVGAGLYGDLNGDGTFGAPGAEHLGTSLFGTTCLVCIGKSVQVVSLHGPSKTIIDAGNSRRFDPANPTGAVNNAVDIYHGGATFSGFTVTDAFDAGIAVELGTGIRISNNIARANAVGFKFQVDDGASGNTYVQDNVAIANGTGFAVARDETHALNQLFMVTGNVASGNTYSGLTVSVSGITLQIIANTINDNGRGVTLSGIGHLLKNNSVLGNRGDGIFISGALGGTGMTLTGNTIVGNSGAGIRLFFDVENDTIEANNIYGNRGLVSGPPNLGNTTNCGLVNTGFELSAPVPIDATHNYWGSSTGPGADPADNAGAPCDFNGGQTLVKPFATSPFALAP